MSRVTFDFSGLDDLSKGLHRAGVAVTLPARQAIRAVGKGVVDDAKAAAPKATGHLADSIAMTTARGKLDGDALMEAEIGPTAFYGRFVEFGTSKMPPRPFMGPREERVAELEALLLEAGFRALS